MAGSARLVLRSPKLTADLVLDKVDRDLHRRSATCTRSTATALSTFSGSTETSSSRSTDMRCSPGCCSARRRAIVRQRPRSRWRPLCAGPSRRPVRRGDRRAGSPAVLALVPPTLALARLPPTPLPADVLVAASQRRSSLGCREALRLRCRWAQELERSSRHSRLGFSPRRRDGVLRAKSSWSRELTARRAARRPSSSIVFQLEFGNRKAQSAPGPPLPTAFKLLAVVVRRRRYDSAAMGPPTGWRPARVVRRAWSVTSRTSSRLASRASSSSTLSIPAWLQIFKAS